MEPRYAEIEVNLSDEDGNAFAIISRVRRAMRRGKVPAEEIDAFTKDAQSGDYDNVIQSAMRYVTVT